MPKITVQLSDKDKKAQHQQILSAIDQISGNIDTALQYISKKRYLGGPDDKQLLENEKGTITKIGESISKLRRDLDNVTKIYKKLTAEEKTEVFVRTYLLLEELNKKIREVFPANPPLPEPDTYISTLDAITPKLETVLFNGRDLPTGTPTKRAAGVPGASTTPIIPDEKLSPKDLGMILGPYTTTLELKSFEGAAAAAASASASESASLSRLPIAAGSSFPFQAIAPHPLTPNVKSSSQPGLLSGSSSSTFYKNPGKEAAAASTLATTACSSSSSQATVPLTHKFKSPSQPGLLSGSSSSTFHEKLIKGDGATSSSFSALNTLIINS